jgi:uncharacterized protein YbjT (DUF2867 family)
MSTASRDVLIAGATGLVGGHLLDGLLASATVSRVHAMLRRSTHLDHPKLREIRLSFEDLATHPGATLGDLAVDAAFCCLGTTRANAGSAAAFRRVDLDYVRAFALAAKAAGARVFALNSSVGADAGSGNLYLRTKGEAETACREAGFESLLIFRPGLLRGKRAEFRPAERLAALAAPLTDRLMAGPLARYRSIEAERLAAIMLRETLAAGPGEQVFEGPRLQAGGARSPGGVADSPPVS